ncbi:hypothetical protein BDF19DRAFT_429441, partial [Syncephalis fuscata]
MHPLRSSSRRNYAEKETPTTSESSCLETNKPSILTDADNTGRDYARNASESPSPSTDHNQQQHMPISLHHDNNAGNNKATLASTAACQTLQSGHATAIGTSDQRPASIALSSFSSVTIPVALSPNEVICAPLEPPKRKLFGGALATSTSTNPATGTTSNSNRLVYDPVSPMIVGAVPTVQTGIAATTRANGPVHTTIKSAPAATNESIFGNSRRTATTRLQAQQNSAPTANAYHSSEATNAAPTITTTTTNNNNNNGNGNSNSNNSNVFRVAQYIRRPMVAPNPSLATIAALPTVNERNSSLRRNQLRTAVAPTNTNVERDTMNRSALASDDKDEPSCIYSCHYNFYHTLKTLFCGRN